MQGPEAHGWRNNLWTSLRVREVIKRHFNIEFCRSQVWHILTDYLRWSAKRPLQQLKARDDFKVKAWVDSKFPEIIRKTSRRHAYLVFIDETGFMMYPTVRKTFAPPKTTPINKVSDPHGRISTIGAIAISPENQSLSWHYSMLDDNRNYRGSGVVDFLRKLRADIPAPMTIVWDQIIIHSCDVVQNYVATDARIVFEPFPPYAPELNPVDRAWFYIKYDQLPNFTPRSTPQLRKAVEREMRLLDSHPELLSSFIRQSELPPFLSNHV